MDKNYILLTVAISLIALVIGFFGGRYYESTHRPYRANFGNAQMMRQRNKARSQYNNNGNINSVSPSPTGEVPSVTPTP